MRRLLLAGALLLAALVAGPARAGGAVPWYVGLPVAQVSLEAPLGGLPRENLEPLLRVRQGEPLDLADVRQDLALLVRAASFARVDALAEPWLDVGPDGELRPGVRLTYRVEPPPRIVRLDIDGGDRPARRVALDAAGLHLGQPFYAGEDVDRVAERVRRALAAEGWPEARVSVQAEEPAPRELAVRVLLDVGPPHRLGRVDLTGSVFDEAAPGEPPPLAAWRVRRRLRRHGLAPGRRVSAQALDAASRDLEDLLVDAGWLQGRVSYLVEPDPDDPTVEHLGVILDGGPRTVVEGHGRGLPSGTALRELLGLGAGDRVSPELTRRDGERRVRAMADRRGWLDAEVEVAVEEQPWGNRVTVRLDRGPRAVLEGVDIEGATAFSPTYLADAMREAAPDTLGRRVLSRAGLDAAVQALVELYRGQGYLDAEVEVADLGLHPPGLLGARRRGRPTVRVREGPRTVLRSLRVEGGDEAAAPPAVAARLAEARRRFEGQPIDPLGLDALAREVAQGWREAGYLSADARVETRVAEGEAEAVLLVEPGQRALLRSIVVRGNRHTRRDVILRHVPLEVGEPISPSALAATRSRLYALDLFDVVDPTLLGEDEAYRDLLLRVEEKPTLGFELGGGVATDQGVQARGRAVDRNIGGLGHRLEAVGQVGYGWASDEWRLDLAQPVWSAALVYQAPDVPVPGHRAVGELLLHETQQRPTWRLDRSGVRVGWRVGREGIDEFWLDAGVQRRRLDDVDTGAVVSGDPWADRLGLADGVADLPSAARVLGGPSFLVLRDRRNDRFNPTRGWLASANGAATVGLGEPPSLKGSLRGERLFGLGPGVLAAVVRGGAAWVPGAGTTLGVEDRFYLGGSGSLRGFRLNEVGPANEVARPDIGFPAELAPVIDATALASTPAHWVPTGGDAMAALSVELRLPASSLGLGSLDSTSLVAFADGGWVGFLDPAVVADSDARAPDRPRLGVGLGLRVATPIGPATFDLGVNPFPLTWRDEPRVVPHFALGAL